MQEPWPSKARRASTDSLGCAGSHAEPSISAHDKRWLTAGIASCVGGQSEAGAQRDPTATTRVDGTSAQRLVAMCAGEVRIGGAPSSNSRSAHWLTSVAPPVRSSATTPASSATVTWSPVLERGGDRLHGAARLEASASTGAPVLVAPLRRR